MSEIEIIALSVMGTALYFVMGLGVATLMNKRKANLPTVLIIAIWPVWLVICACVDGDIAPKGF
jgi:hypothetical protein